MLLESLRFRNFRCFDELTLSLEPGVNWFFGPNATGKTSILEAIYYCISGRSFRTSRPFELIKHTEKAFSIHLLFQKHEVSQNLAISISDQQKQILLNATKYPNFSSLLGVLQGVVFTTEDLNLVKGGPTYRRLFLDIQLAQTDPLYVYHLARYTRALKQRNALLKMRSTQAIEVWENELAKSASYLMQKRASLCESLQVSAQETLRSLSATKDTLNLNYRPSYPSTNPNEICKHLHKQRKRDLDKQSSLTGPHRDDILLHLNEKDLRHYSSEGQKLSCVASLKLAEWTELKKRCGEDPLFLVDDIGACLDSNRTARFLEILSGVKQCFISSPALESNATHHHVIAMDPIKV